MNIKATDDVVLKCLLIRLAGAARRLSMVIDHEASDVYRVAIEAVTNAITELRTYIESKNDPENFPPL